MACSPSSRQVIVAGLITNPLGVGIVAVSFAAAARGQVSHRRLLEQLGEPTQVPFGYLLKLAWR